MLVNEIPVEVLVTHNQGEELVTPKKCKVLFVDKITEVQDDDRAVETFVVVVYDEKRKLRPLLLSDCIILKTRRYGMFDFGTRTNSGRKGARTRSEKRVGNNSTEGSGDKPGELKSSKGGSGEQRKSDGD